ncbi:MAG: GNAT family N-acetyltransferase [Ramlibacter sp.]
MRIAGLLSMTCALRIAQPADALRIAVLGSQVFLDTYASEGISQSIAEEALEYFTPDAISLQLADASTAFIVAESSGHMVGFAHVVLGMAHPLVSEVGGAKLNRLYVLERFTGRGIGKSLLLQAEALAASKGAPILWLTAWVGNRRALAFYPGRGYEDLGATDYVFQGESFENRLFAKALQLS